MPRIRKEAAEKVKYQKSRIDFALVELRSIADEIGPFTPAQALTLRKLIIKLEKWQQK